MLGFGEGSATRLEIARFPAGLNGLVLKTADADLVHRHAQVAELPVPPNGVIEEFGKAAANPAGRAGYMAALALKVGSLAAARQRPHAVPGVRIEPHRVVVPATAAFKTTLVFSE